MSDKTPKTSSSGREPAEFLLAGISPDEVGFLVAVNHADPHRVLGAHPIPEGVVVRAFHPEASRAWLLAPDHEPLEMIRCHRGGLFAVLLRGATLPRGLPTSF